MDSKDRDESKIRRREETLARRMGEALDRIDPRGAGACPDAEILAAYAEQALGPDEAAQWEGHFAACGRCRKILRVLAASTDTPLAGKEVAQLGELISAVHSPVHSSVEITGKPARQGHPKLVDWRTRWLAPALGLAAALAVWFAMRPPWRATERGASQTLIAQAPREEALPLSPTSPTPMESERLSRVAPLQDQKAQAAPDLLAGNTQSLNSPAGALVKRHAESDNALKKESPSADAPTGTLQKEGKSRSLADKLDAQPPTETVSPQPPQAKAALGPPAVPSPLPAARAQSEAATVTGSAPLVETTNGALSATVRPEKNADVPLNGRNYQAFQTFGPARKFFALLKAPSGLMLWRAGQGGMIEHSTDAGKTWVAEISPSQEDWLAGAAVSDTICWLVGRNSAIARSTDGNQWERVAPPAQASLAAGKMADWTGITARDAQTATITASDGRKFATSDGGKTWQMQQ
jgi:hypothetical protein